MSKPTTTRLRHLFLLPFCISLLVGSLTASLAARGGDDDTDGTPPDVEPAVQPGVVVVKVRSGTFIQAGASKTGVPSLDRLGRQYRVRAVKQMFPFLERTVSRKRLSPVTRSLLRVYTIHYDAPIAPREVVTMYAGDPHVILAEPRYAYPTTRLPRAADPLAADRSRPADPQLIPNDSLYDEMTHLPQIRVPEAWDITTGQDGGVVVAVVDGGTDWEHPDLQPNVWTNDDEIDNNGLDDDDNGYVDDIHGWNFATDSPDPTGTTPENRLHGTAVAGVVSAVADNQIGIVGASWNTTFMPVGAGCEDPEFDGSICYGLQGILYAAFNGADVINASWGGIGFSQLGQEVIELVRDQDVLVVAASGNAGVNIDRSPTFPGSARSVLTVGATQKSSDQVTGFSNFGESVDVFAPGININTTVPADDDSYMTLNGTSFSTPLVSGVAALVKTYFPDYSLEQVREQVRVTSERIDDENSGFSGFLGQGRVNALRALTVTDIPSVRITEAVMIDADQDSLAEPGESIDLLVTMTNFLSSVSSASAELIPQDTLVTVTSGTASLGALATGETAQTTFTFEVAEDAPQGRQVVFFAEISAGNHSNTEVIRVVVNPAQAIEHTTQPMQVSITSEGNIGFTTFPDTPNSQGVGFEFNGRNLLFEGGLLVGTGASRISDCIRGDDPDVLQEQDFIPQVGSQLEIIRPGEFTTEEGLVTLVDDSAETPIDISVRQETYVDESDLYDEFIVFRYLVTNQDTVRKTDLHAGIFLDWDVDENDSSTDYSKFDRDRRLGYVLDDLAASAAGGLKLLTTDAEMSYRAIDNPEEIYQQTAGGFSPQEKWDYMTGGIEQTELNNTDVSQLMAAGPYALEPGASVEVAFAVLGGASEGQLLEHADRAQELWDETLSKISVDIEEPAPTSPAAFSLKTIYPNPTISSTTFGYQVAEPGRVTLKVYDLLGREIRTLVANRRSSGSHEVTWNGLNDIGNRAANGLYLVRLTVSTDGQQFTQTRKLMLVR